MDLQALLQQIPPGVDLFDFLAETLTAQVYPDLGKAFSVQVYVCTILCCMVIAIITAGLVIRLKNGRLHFFVADGPATRPNPKLFVPILWLIAGACMIAHTFWLRSALRTRYLSYGLGAFWWLTAASLPCSYAIVATSVMCSAPVIRRLLMRLNAGHPSSRLSPSFLAINFTVFVVCLLAVCPLYVPAEMLGSSFRYVQDGFTGLQGLLAEAKGTGNIALLASAIIHVESLDEGLRRKSRSALIGGAIYSAEVVIFFLFGLIPSLLLNTYMRKRIDRLERGLNLTSLNQSASLGHHSIVPLPITLKDSQPFGDRREEAETLAEPHVDQPAQQQLELPRDRPFANLTPAALVPSNYATIMQAQVDPKEKAKRLKAALLRDNLQLGAYFLMLAAMGSLAFFQAAKVSWQSDAKRMYLLNYTWEIWSYLIPAIILAAAFLYDAIASTQQEEEMDPTIAVSPGRTFQVHPSTSIQLSQTVQVVEEHALQEKKILYERFDA